MLIHERPLCYYAADRFGAPRASPQIKSNILFIERSSRTDASLLPRGTGSSARSPEPAAEGGLQFLEFFYMQRNAGAGKHQAAGDDRPEQRAQLVQKRLCLPIGQQPVGRR